MRLIGRFLAVAAIALLPGTAAAQALRCTVPAFVPAPHADLPSAEQPRRVLPIGGYTLAITWAPQYCRSNAGDRGARFECASGNRFGFTLHGLWPDGEGAVWPQYCRATAILPDHVIRRTLCATPSPQLIQHEWAKHGTCMSERPSDYFAESNRLYARLRYPDMAALSRAPLTAGALAQAIAAANPGMSADMMRITATRQGWLDEIWLCLNKQRRFVRCPAHQGGIAATTPIRIWRGRAR